MIGLLFAVLLVVFAWRLGDAFDKRRRKRLEFGHYVWDGVWVVDGVIADAVPPAQPETTHLPRLKPVGEGGYYAD